MNCKPGDLAVIVKGSTDILGRYVEVMRPSEFPYPKDWWFVRSAGGSLVNTNGERVTESNAEDAQLRPIRPSEGQDETLSWAPVPAKETA